MDRLQSMRAFQRVADEGGFAAAARSLDLSPAVVTRLVADLEEHLGTRLLHRTTRRLSLTEAGEAYLNRVRHILQDLDEVHAEISSHTHELAGVLRVVTPPVLATYVLAPLIAGFRQQYPKISLDIEVKSTTSPAVEEYDIALLLSDANVDADIVVRRITESDAILVASPGYLQRRGVPSTPQELAGHECLRLKELGARPGPWRMWCEQCPEEPVDVDVQPVLWANHTDTLLRAALDGAGIACVAVELAAPYLTRGELTRVLAPWITGHLSMFAAFPSRKFMPQRSRVFLDYLIEQTRVQLQSARAACVGCDGALRPGVSPLSVPSLPPVHSARAGTVVLASEATTGA